MENKSYIVDPSAFDTPANIAPGVYDNSVFDTAPAPAPENTWEERIGKAAEYLPTAGAIAGGAVSALAAPGTAGASLLGGSALAGLGAAAGKAGEQLVKRAVGVEAPKTSGEAAGEIFKEGAWTTALNAAGVKVMDALAPAGKLLAKQVMKGFARIDERTALKVLNDPSILSRAKDLPEAKKSFSKFFEDIGYDYGENSVKAATGKMNLGDNEADDFIGEVILKIDGLSKMPKTAAEQEAKFVVQDALAARYSLKDAINRAGRSGNDSKMRLFLQGKNQIDDWLETQIPGFSAVRKEYEEAKIKKAFDPIFPLNKNKETSVLGILTSIGATLGTGGAVGLPAAIPAAVVSSPKLTGLAIRGAAKGGAAMGAGVAELAGKKAEEMSTAKTAETVSKSGTAIDHLATMQKLAPEVSQDILIKGFEMERKDHPEIPAEIIPNLVADELKKDPKFYDKE